MSLIVNILFGLVFSVSLAGLGVFVIKKTADYDIDFISGFFIGCGLSAVLLFLIGLLGLYNWYVFLVYIIIVFLFSVYGRRTLAKVSLVFEWQYLIPLLVLVSVIVFAGLVSLSPPIKNDTLYYHLGLPKLWAVDGGIKFYPFISFSTTALNSEVLLTPILSFVSPEAAQFFVFLVGIMVVLLAGKIFTKLTGQSPILVYIVLGAVSFYITGITDAKNDYLATGFALTAFYFYADYLESRQSRSIVLAGILAGLAASTKANAIIFVIAMFVTIVISRHRLKDIAMFAAAAIVLSTPWYIKAWATTGNPFYPLFNNYFHSPYWNDLFNSFNKATFVASEKQSLLNIITAPFRLIYLPDIFRARLGPLPLIALPLLLVIKNIPVALKKGLIISLVYFILWYVAWPGGRYLMPIIPILCLAAAYAIFRISSYSRVVKMTVLTGITLLTVLSGVQVFRDGIVRAKTSLGLIGRDAFMENVTVLDPNQLKSSQRDLALPYINIWDYLNVHAPGQAKVAILCSNWNRADAFYLDRPFVYLNPTGQNIVRFYKSRSDIANDMVENDFQYVLIDKAVLAEFTANSDFADAPNFGTFARGVRDFVDIAKQNGRVVYLTDRFILYQLENLNTILKEPFS